ncbi:MAG TPA: PD-(D/E)XK nuclease family protein [Bryobacteraceae bacterium]|nr:PD-(D/E)XK nuclease family protein [Bryobacteraceae bacterium]
MHRLVQSASYAVLLDGAAEFLASMRDYPEILVIAHTRGAADDFVRSACQTGFIGVHRTTLTGLAVDLAEAPRARAGLTPLSALSAEAMVARVIHKLKADGIPYFQPVADTPGLARAVAASIAELRQGDVRPEAVEGTGLAGSDLARMAALFERELADASMADFALLLRQAIQAAREGKHRLLGLPVVLLDVDLESALRRELMEAVLERAASIYEARLEQGGGDRPVPSTTLDRVRQSLFSPAASPDGEPDDSLQYFSAAGESLECVEIARRIRKLAADGLAFDRMAILLHSPERYQPLVEEALRRAGVPAYFSRGVARPDPSGRAFLALLACAGEGCSATRFAEYLSLGQAPPIGHSSPIDSAPPDDEVLAHLYPGTETRAAPVAAPGQKEDDDAPVIGGTVQTPRHWEKLLVDAAVIGGRDRWQRRLRGLEAEFRLRLSDLDPKEEGRRQQLENEIARLKNLESFALPLIDRLSDLPRQAVWGDWIDHLSALAGAALRHPESVVSVLDELQAMAEVGPVGLDEVSGVLRDRLRSLRREPLLRRYGGVFVAGIEEARGRVFDVVFLPGLCEGLFPSRPREDPILLDVHRAKLSPRRLRRQDDRVAAERRRLHIACAAARAKLVFSYPRVDAVESRPRVPSFYALEIVRAALGRLPDLRTFEETARQGAPSRLDWPAPVEPLEAIDDAEFDLASLGRTFTLPAADARATGRYLIDANEHLVRSLRAYARRARPAWSYADGIVDPDAATRAALATQRLAARSYSPSALQHFAACPYRFLLHAIHRFHPREERVALEQLDALTRGALFHETQFRLFGELRSAQLLPIRPQNAGRAAQLADSVLDSVAARYEEDLAPAIPRVWRSEIEDLRTDLRGWIDQVAAEDRGWIPTNFEFSFGLEAGGARDPSSTAAEAVLDNGVRLRGAIDLIERHSTRGTLRITDHKTGKPPQDLPKYVAGGVMLQPLAYAMAAERILGVPCEVSRLSYCTQRGGYQEILFEVTPGHRRFFTHVLSLIDGEIDRGFLPAAPQQGACTYCDYAPVCGPNEESRTRKKRQDALEALQTLRNIP